MEVNLNPDYNNINIASSILEATNTESHETLTIYPDLDTLVSIAQCSKKEKNPIIHTFESEIAQNEVETVYPGFSASNQENDISLNKKESSNSNDSDVRFKCPVCRSTFSEETKYQDHLVTHQRLRVDCNYCGKNIAYHRFLTHIMVHTGEKPHKCDICGRGFRLKRYLRQHSFTHTGELPYPCDVCGKKFADTSSRRKHLQIHTGERPYSCEICQKSFTQISHLREHQVTHTKEKSHTCELCLKKFTTRSSMQRHMLTHDNTCEVCKCTFTTNNKLQKHRELHDAERPFSCPICLRRFRKRTDINTHMIIHSEEKNVICKICNDAFKSYRYLRVHYAGSHKGVEPPFRCNLCQKRFFQDHSMKRHYAAHFSDSYKRAKCPQCSVTFSCAATLKKHNSLKNCSILKCYECDEKYKNKDDLVEHLKMCHDLFSDCFAVPDSVNDVRVKEELISPQGSSGEEHAEKNTNFFNLFPDSSNKSFDEMKSTPKNGAVLFKNSSFASKPSRRNKTATAHKNYKLPTIVKVEVMSDASSFSFSEHESNSCSSDKH